MNRLRCRVMGWLTGFSISVLQEEQTMLQIINMDFFIPEWDPDWSF